MPSPAVGERPIRKVTSVGRSECGNANGIDWTAVYVIHNDASQGWQITFDHGRTWAPRHTLPTE